MPAVFQPLSSGGGTPPSSAAALPVLAARIHDFGAPPRIDRIPAPAGPPPGHALVDVEAAAVAHIDLTVASGRFVNRPRLPYVLGTEAAGRVVRGALPEGTRVRVRGAGVGVRSDGTCAERIVVPDAAVHPLDEHVDAAVGAAFFSPAATAHVAVRLLGELREGETVAVTGVTGVVGRMVTQLALAAGAGRVLAVTREETTSPQLPAGCERRAGTTAVTEDDRFDLLIDLVGGPVLRDLLGWGHPGARAVLVGYASGSRLTLDLPNFIAGDVQLRPLSLLRWAPVLADVADDLLAQVLDGRLDLPIVERPIEELPDALVAMTQRTLSGRLVVRPTHRKDTT